MSTTHNSLNLQLDANSVLRYKVHPVVVFSVLDHYKRRSEGQHRVIGTLLGQFDDVTGECIIKECYPVPHVETEDSVALDQEYMQNMLSLHQRINKNNIVVGWYSTGDDITYTSSRIHEVFKTQTEQPVLLTVDVNVRKHNRLGVKGYVGKTLKVGPSSVARFENVIMDIFAYEGEKIAVDALINGNPEGDQLDAAATIQSDFENLYRSLAKLCGLLESAAKYAKAVKDGSIEGDNEIGMAISHAMSAIPHLDARVFDKMFSNNMQDLLMVLYLTNMTRTHLALADKINLLL